MLLISKHWNVNLEAKLN